MPRAFIILLTSTMTILCGCVSYVHNPTSFSHRGFAMLTEDGFAWDPVPGQRGPLCNATHDPAIRYQFASSPSGRAFLATLPGPIATAPGTTYYACDQLQGVRLFDGTYHSATFCGESHVTAFKYTEGAYAQFLARVDAPHNIEPLPPGTRSVSIAANGYGVRIVGQVLEVRSSDNSAWERVSLDAMDEQHWTIGNHCVASTTLIAVDQTHRSDIDTCRVLVIDRKAGTCTAFDRAFLMARQSPADDVVCIAFKGWWGFISRLQWIDFAGPQPPHVLRTCDMGDSVSSCGTISPDHTIVFAWRRAMFELQTERSGNECLDITGPVAKRIEYKGFEAGFGWILGTPGNTLWQLSGQRRATRSNFSANCFSQNAPMARASMHAQDERCLHRDPWRSRLASKLLATKQPPRDRENHGFEAK